MTVFILILSLAWFALTLWHATDLLQYLQLLEYLNGRFLSWSFKHVQRVSRVAELPVLLGLLAGLAIPGLANARLYIAILLLGWASAIVISLTAWGRSRQTLIKPLVYTGRVIRLLIADLILLVVEWGLLLDFCFGVKPWAFFSPWPISSAPVHWFFMLGLWLLSQITVFNLAAANLLTYPVEAAMRAYYVHSAETIMRQVHPVVIGITGSYGKTSTKEILAHLLGSKYEVLKTPKTYNTIMGVCMVIREQLKPNHKYFIVEMGAYKPGEIARICRLVHPQMAILTAIGPQHLERFKTIENIAHAKNELIQALPADGIAIINGDDPICRKLADEAHVKVLAYGMQPDSPSLNLRASQPITSESGASFDITLDGQPAGTVRTQLLGRHNITNALGAMLTAMQCGLSATEVVHALASVTTLEHRLQIIRNPGGIITIDNAYSSNPSGSQVALEVLGSFKNGRKVIVTPGFAELGSLQAQEHAKLGRNAAQVCDLIFLIGSPERVSEIMAGVREAGFDPEKVFTYLRLAEAREKLREVLQPGDVVLFENDLPDTYSL